MALPPSFQQPGCTPQARTSSESPNATLSSVDPLEHRITHLETRLAALRQGLRGPNGTTQRCDKSQTVTASPADFFVSTSFELNEIMIALNQAQDHAAHLMAAFNTENVAAVRNSALTLSEKAGQICLLSTHLSKVTEKHILQSLGGKS